MNILHPFSRTIGHHLKDDLRRHAEDDQVDLVRDMANTWIGRKPQDAFRRGMNGENFSFEMLLDGTFNIGGAPPSAAGQPASGRSADHGDIFGVEQGLQGMYRCFTH